MTMAWVLLGVAGVLIVGNAIFVAAETALVTVDRNLVESRAREGSVRFGRVRGALQRLSTYLSGAQLGITVTSLAIGFVAEPSIAALLRRPLDALGLDADVTEIAALALALLLATAVQMVFGELVPKNIAFVATCRQRCVGGHPPMVFTKVTRPLIAVLNGTANQLLRLVGVEPVEELRSARTPDELASVVRRAGVQGALDSETAGLMERSLSFSAKTAADVMTPRTRVRTVSASSPVATVIEATRDTGHSRFPVIGDSVDDIRGVVHVKQAVAVARGGSHDDTHPRRDDSAGARAALHGVGPTTRSATRKRPATGGSGRRVRRHRRDRHLRRPGGGACRRRRRRTRLARTRHLAPA